MAPNLPKDFVFLTDIDPTIIENPRYCTHENFLGRPVAGYTTTRIICTEKAAQALKLVQAAVKPHGYKLVVYDGYRPQRATKEFAAWGKDANDDVAKDLYYPTISKQEIFAQRYLTERSSHSRGSTFDLTLIPLEQNLTEINVSKRTLNNQQEISFLDDNTVDMGSSFDLFHEVSHHGARLITEQQTAMRNLLRDAMQQHGFAEYPEEWWHYTLVDEPYPDTYFDFVVN